MRLIDVIQILRTVNYRVLFDITPHIESWAYDTNSLADYMASLDKVYDLPVDLVLPGHRNFRGSLKERIDELKIHHRKRADEVLKVLGSETLNAYAIAARMSWDIDCETWEDFPIAQRWFATGEAIAHLRYLDMLYGDCVICDATNAPPHFLTTLDHALEVAPANPTLLYYDSRLEAGGTANAAYFATATQEASLAIRPELPGPSPSAAAPVSTAASVATASRRPATPTPWARPNPTPGVPSGTQNARSVWRSRAPLQAIGIVLLIAVGLAAWMDRRRRQPTPRIDSGAPNDSRREPPSAEAPDGL